MGETAVAMPRPADSPVGVPAPREAPRVASAPPSPPNRSTPSQTDRLKIKETEEQALAATKREIEEAKARSKGKTETSDATPPVKTAPPPPPPDAAPQLPHGVTQADVARLRQNITDKVMTQQEAEAEFEKLVNKAAGIPDETHSTPSVSQKKTAHKEVTPPSPKTSSASTPPSVEHKTENSLLSKVKNIAEKIFSTPLAIIKAIWSWVTK